ncbi:MAG TPA: hypothetical protein HPP76_03845 [Desulfuromonadales bacterium]|nr:hypothetical protein [Desulfuromonadales bacterium]
MPEIINQNRVNAKLREFDEQMDGAIKAAEKIVKVRLVAENFEDEFKWTTNKITELLDSLKEIHGDWNSLKSKIDSSVTATGDLKHQAEKELNDIKQLLDALVDEAAKKLQQENIESLQTHHQYITESKTTAEAILNAKDSISSQLMEQALFFDTVRKKYDEEFSNKGKALLEEASNHAETIIQTFQNTLESYMNDSKEAAGEATAAKDFCGTQGEKLEQLIDAAREEYNVDFSRKYSALIEEVGKHADGIIRSNQQTLDDFRQEMASKLEEFQNRMKEDIDRQLTDFLAKQNILVQNFGQQVDGFQRSLSSHKNELEQMDKKIVAMEAKVETTAKWYSDCSSRQDAEIVKLRERDAEVTLLKERLDRTLELLQNTGMVFSGGKFKGI